MATDETLQKILNYLVEHDEGVNSQTIAEMFLALKGGNDTVVNLMVSAVLKRSPLAWADERGLWFARETDSPLLMNSPFLICVPLLSEDRRSVIQIALMKYEGDDRELLYTLRLRESDEMLMVRGEKTVDSLSEGFGDFIRHLSRGRLLFPAQYEQRLLLKYLLDAGFSLPENTLLLSHIYRMARVPMNGRKGGLVALAEGVVPVAKEPVTAGDHAELCADLIHCLMMKLQETGVSTLNQFNEREKEETLHAKWDRAQFTLEDFCALDERPGVYGYKDENNDYIYVGKGVNVRARMITYFRNSDESPAKLMKLRESAVTFTCHYCGNELEAVILESRLIQKYSPPLNTQVAVHPLKGEYSRIPSGIYLLPGQSDDECYTLWFNGNGTVITRTIKRSADFTVSAAELKQFFFTETQAEPTTESLLVERWLRPRLHDIDRIDVESCENSEQLMQIFSETVMLSSGDGTIYR